DNAGNRSSMTLSGYAGNSTENYSYDKNNRLISSVINSGTISAYTDYTYDKNGNQTKIEKYSKNNEGKFKLSITNAIYQSNAGIQKFTYNGLNQLTGYESTNRQYNGKVGLSAEYKYMANGYRLSKNVNGEETRYLWDKNNIVSELNDINVISHRYYRGYNLVCDDSNTYYMHDPHGNVIETYTGSNKYCDDLYIYNAFGTNKYFNDTGETDKWGYCDQLKDFETGNYYMRARYYNPDTGRFISEDPIKDGSNWYSYCAGNPVAFKDISGKIKISDGMYNYNTQLKLLDYSVQYNIARLNNNVVAMNAASQNANNLRNNSSEMGMFEKIVDDDAAWLNFETVTAYEKAKSCGLKEGSLEFGLVVTDFIIQAERERKNIEMTYNFTMISIASSIILSNGFVRNKTNNSVSLENIRYSDKVKQQMEWDDYHGFPSSVDAFDDYATVTKLTNQRDGKVRTRLQIPGSYKGKDGFFEYIIEPNGIDCNHRVFVPKK
ncbi:RHS repeat-associated core domain-containing protein, partial [uncultured Thomasclavelia sp.]|uniref:RHS repeat domain-containing protein n=1 Tax=uncultured Thomasclavelia sp. TaxID=3025759 RepID=UPI00280AFE88